MIRPFVGPTADIPLDVHWPYLLASIGFVGFCARRRPGDRPLLLAIAIALWANVAVDFLFAPATSYSYSDLSPPLALVLAMWDGRRARSALSASSAALESAWDHAVAQSHSTSR